MIEINPLETANKIMHSDEFMTKMLLGGIEVEENSMDV